MLVIRILILNQNLKLNVFYIFVIGLIFPVENILLPALLLLLLLLFDGNISILTFKDLLNTFEKRLKISICGNEILQNLDSSVLSCLLSCLNVCCNISPPAVCGVTL